MHPCVSYHIAVLPAPLSDCDSVPPARLLTRSCQGGKMLRISTKGQYALLIMTDLAEHDPEKYISLKLLSHRHNLSVKYLEQILIQLSKAGLVLGLRGNNGGYKLARRPEEYKVGEILRAMEGDLNPRSLNDSNTVSTVGNDDFWKEFEAVINNFVDSNTLEHIAEKNRQFNGYDYCI